MKMIVVNDGLKGAGIGWVFLICFLFLFLSLLFDRIREKRLLEDRKRARKMIEEGNARLRRQAVSKTVEQKTEPEPEETPVRKEKKMKKKKEEETWKEQVKKRARDDIRFFR